MAIENQACYRCLTPLRVTDKSLAGQRLPCPDCGAELFIELVQGQLRIGSPPPSEPPQHSRPVPPLEERTSSSHWLIRWASPNASQRYLAALAGVNPRSIGVTAGLLIASLVVMLAWPRPKPPSPVTLPPRAAVVASPVVPSIQNLAPANSTAAIPSGESHLVPPLPTAAVEEPQLIEDEIPASALAALSSSTRTTGELSEIPLPLPVGPVPVAVPPTAIMQPPFDLAKALELPIQSIKTTPTSTRGELIELLGELLGRPISLDQIPAEVRTPYLAERLSINLQESTLAILVETILSKRYQLVWRENPPQEQIPLQPEASPQPSSLLVIPATANTP